MRASGPDVIDDGFGAKRQRNTITIEHIPRGDRGVASAIAGGDPESTADRNGDVFGWVGEPERDGRSRPPDPDP